MKRSTRKNIRDIVITSVLASLIGFGILYASSRDFSLFDAHKDPSYTSYRDYNREISEGKRDPKTGLLIDNKEENYNWCGR